VYPYPMFWLFLSGCSARYCCKRCVYVVCCVFVCVYAVVVVAVCVVKIFMLLICSFRAKGIWSSSSF